MSYMAVEKSPFGAPLIRHGAVSQLPELMDRFCEEFEAIQRKDYPALTGNARTVARRSLNSLAPYRCCSFPTTDEV